MTERLIQQYSGQGNLVFNDQDRSAVNYEIYEFQNMISDGAGGEMPSLRSLRGRVSHVKGHPDWHPIVLLNREPATLVLRDGRKLKVFMRDSEGSVEATGDFF